MTSHRQRLTDRTIKAIKPGPKTVDYPDEMTPGLVLRVTPSGGKSFGLRYRWQGSTTRLSLGSYATIAHEGLRGLAAARAKARDAQAKLKSGINPADIPAMTMAARELTFALAVERWADNARHNGHRSVAMTKRLLDLHAVPALGTRPMIEIRRREVVRLLETLRGKGLRAQVNRVQRAISGVFSWAMDAGEIDGHPLAGLKPLVKEAAREASLDMDQLAALWRAADLIPSLAGPVVKLLILTGQRREEVTGMRWSEIDGQTWRIPAARSKSKRPHEIALGPLAAEIIAAQPRFVGCPFVFPGRDRNKPFAGWRRAAVSLKALANLGTDWRIHDIRRSVATQLGETLDIPEEITARILGHSAKARIGVTATYERSRRMDRIQKALGAWEQAIQAALGRVDPDRVIRLRG